MKQTIGYTHSKFIYCHAHCIINMDLEIVFFCTRLDCWSRMYFCLHFAEYLSIKDFPNVYSGSIDIIWVTGRLFTIVLEMRSIR